MCNLCAPGFNFFWESLILYRKNSINPASGISTSPAGPNSEVLSETLDPLGHDLPNISSVTSYPIWFLSTHFPRRPQLRSTIRNTRPVAPWLTVLNSGPVISSPQPCVVCPRLLLMITAGCHWRLYPDDRLLILESIARARAGAEPVLRGYFLRPSTTSLTITRIS